MKHSKRTRLLGVVVAAVIASGAVAFACGSDDAAGGDAACTTPDCDGGGAEAAGPDGATADGAVPDGGSDSDADAAVDECDGAGAGTLDPTFGDGGLVWLKYPGAQATSVAVQADGKILVGGGTSPRKFALVRLLPNGTPDPTWGVNGLVETQIAKTYNYTYQALAIQPDGKIIAVGMVDLEIDKRSGDFAVVRYNTDGTLDTTFGQAGAAFADFGAANFAADYPTALIIQPDTRIVVGGFSEPPGAGSADYAIARFTSAGALDTTFGTGGKLLLDIHGTRDELRALALSANSKITAGGRSSRLGDDSIHTDLTAVRFEASGALDTTFGTGGIFRTAIDGREGASAIAVDSTGRVLLGGQAGAAPNFGLFRLTPGGSPDLSFAEGGIATIDFDGAFDAINAVLIQPDAKILAIGSSSVGANGGSIAAARYSANGAIDPAFGDMGMMLMPPPPNSDLSATASAMVRCSFVTIGTWPYDNNTAGDTAMGIARFNR